MQRSRDAAPAACRPSGARKRGAGGRRVRFIGALRRPGNAHVPVSDREKIPIGGTGILRAGRTKTRVATGRTLSPPLRVEVHRTGEFS